MPLTSTVDVENVTNTVTNDVADHVSNDALLGREHAKSKDLTLRDNVDVDVDDADVDDVDVDTGITITLISNDDRVFHVPLEAAKLSGFIVDTLGLDDDDDSNDENENENENQENEDDTTNKPKQRLHEKQYEPIMIPRVNGEILQMILDFLLHYKYVNPMPKIQQPIVAETFHDVMTDLWYQQYVTQHEQQDYGDHNNNNANMIVFQILHAANFMEISPIIDLTCLWCTFQISRKSSEEIRVFLNLPKMTPEEEAQARAEHPWIFESITPS